MGLARLRPGVGDTPCHVMIYFARRATFNSDTRVKVSTEE